jgi:F0F1-type ATP synthase assembly protein I
MRTIIKVFLTIVAFIIATFIMGVLNDTSGSSSPGILGLVLGAGLIAGIVAIWKYNPENTPETEDKDDKYKLNKS